MSSIEGRLRRLEAETPAPTPTRSPEARDRMVAFLNRYAAWKRAGSPATEEGRELRALGDAVRRRCAERRGEG